MPTRTWEFQLDGNQHIVQFNYNIYSGKLEVWADGQFVSSKRVFDLFGYPCEVGITFYRTRFYYYLIVNNEYIDDARDRIFSKNPDGQKNKLFTDSVFWVNFAKSTNLSYIPSLEFNNRITQRLVGKIRNHWVTVYHGNHMGIPLNTLMVLIRHSKILDLDNTKKLILSDPAIMGIEIKKIPEKDRFNIWENCSTMNLAYNPKTDTPEQISSKILAFANTLVKYTQPTSNDICEGVNCKQKINQENQLVFINNFPFILCPECIKEIPDVGKETLSEYKKSPTGLLKGSMIGFVVATLLGALWTLMMIFLKDFSALVIALVFPIILLAMEKIGTKRTVSSAVITAILSVYGIILGIFLFDLRYFLVRNNWNFYFGILIKAWDRVMINGPLIKIAINMVIVWLIGILFSTFMAQKDLKKQMTTPDIEIISSNILKKYS